MKRFFPAPLLSVAVFVVWLLLVASVEPAQVLLAAILAVVLPKVAHRLREDAANMRRPGVAARLVAIVLWDIVLSNIEVARRILGRESKMRPAFVWIPLDITNRHGISALAGIITMTPGTVSSELSPDQRHLLVHFLHLEDVDAAIAQIKSRYEAPLREVFP